MGVKQIGMVGLVGGLPLNLAIVLGFGWVTFLNRPLLCQLNRDWGFDSRNPFRTGAQSLPSIVGTGDSLGCFDWLTGYTLV